MKPAEESVTVTLFLLWMQQKHIQPCHLFIGDDPQALTGEEIISLKNDFIKELYPESQSRDNQKEPK